MYCLKLQTYFRFIKSTKFFTPMHTQAIINKLNICPFTILISCSFQSVAAQLFVQIKGDSTVCLFFCVLFYVPINNNYLNTSLLNIDYNK